MKIIVNCIHMLLDCLVHVIVTAQSLQRYDIFFDAGQFLCKFAGMLGDFRLKVFLALSKTGSFTKTAAALGISQPAVSQNIAELEKDLGVRLFERGRGEISLTPQGRAFQSYAGKILYLYDSARMMFSPGGPARRKTVRICASGRLAGEPVASLVASMTASFPGTVVIMHESMADFPEDGFGFRLEECAGEPVGISSSGISSPGTLSSGTDRLPSAGFSQVSPSSQDRIPSAGFSKMPSASPSGAVWAGARIVGYSSLAAVVSPVSSTVHSSFASWQDIPAGVAVLDGCIDGLVPFEEISHKIVFRSSSAEAVKALVKSSPGIVGLLPRYAARNELADKSLIRISLPDMPGAARIISMVPTNSFSEDTMCPAVVNLLSEILA